ncbi:hypothetical protein ON010_g18954 [Phytophthora cinnamomi]|nr:hypothetical protein ON010_g18954 [Phytophthora cinnamomi]
MRGRVQRAALGDGCAGGAGRARHALRARLDAHAHQDRPAARDVPLRAGQEAPSRPAVAPATPYLSAKPAY